METCDIFNIIEAGNFNTPHPYTGNNIVNIKYLLSMGCFRDWSSPYIIIL